MKKHTRKKPGYTVRHKEHGFMVTDTLMTGNEERAAVFPSPLDAVNAAIKVWGEDVLAAKVLIRQEGYYASRAA